VHPRTASLVDFPLRPGRHSLLTMESLEVIVVPVVLIGVLLIGAICTAVVVHWLRTTEPLR